MSTLKAKSNLAKLDSVKTKLTSIVVDSTTGAFHVKSASDDFGTHLVVYFEEECRSEIDLKKFRESVHEKLGRKRILIIFAHKGYIENFLRD